MSLNISLTFDNAVVQVSDRRLTTVSKNLVHYEDQANKALVVDTDGGGIFLTYAGLGSTPQSGYIDDWAQKTLKLIFAEKITRWDHVINEFRVRADKLFATIPYRKEHSKLHAFVLTGWFRGEGGMRPYVGVISNFHGEPDSSGQPTLLGDPLPRFNSIFLDGSGRRIITGMFPSFTSDVDKLVLPITRRYQEGKIDQHALVDGLVKVVQSLADDPVADNKIGKYCLSCFWQHKTEKVTMYHAPDEPDEAFGPRYISPSTEISDIKTQGILPIMVFSNEGDNPADIKSLKPER